MTLVERYNHIMNQIQLAKAEGNQRKLKIWRNKLENWRLEYGAHAPIRL